MSHTEVSLGNPRLRVKPLVKSLDRLLRAFDMLLNIGITSNNAGIFPTYWTRESFLSGIPVSSSALY